MIILDSCVVLDIVFGEPQATSLTEFLDQEQASGRDIVFLPLTVLESSSVVAVRYKEGKSKIHDLDYYLGIIRDFGSVTTHGDLSEDIIVDAAKIKSIHAASMVDCYLIANAIARGAEIITADQEILKFRSKSAKIRKLNKKFSAIKWSKP
jgi:predicted nucleic acid-binding protein